MSLCLQLRRLSAEHARWLSVESRAGEADGGARLLTLWDAEILPHCRAEEDVLLPELARRLSEADALVVFTLGDHLVLRRMVRDLRRAKGLARAAAADSFLAKLAEHVTFEERTLLPALQEALGCGRLAELEAELVESGRDRSSRPAESPPVANAARRKGSNP